MTEYNENENTTGFKIFAALLIALYFCACILLIALSTWCFNLSDASDGTTFLAALQSAFGFFTGFAGGAGITIGFFLLLEEVFG